MASNCEDCFDRSVTIPVGPQGPAGADGADGVCPECESLKIKNPLLINLFTSQVFHNDNFVNCLSGNVPADSLEQVGDMLIVEAWFFGNPVNPSISVDQYSVRLRVDGNNLQLHSGFSSNPNINVNGVYLKYGITLTNVINKTVRWEILEVRPSNALPLNVSPLEYSFVDNNNSIPSLIGVSSSLFTFNLTDLSTPFSIQVRGKNTTGLSNHTYLCPRLIVTLKKVS
jgi:hypothetical protein